MDTIHRKSLALYSKVIEKLSPTKVRGALLTLFGMLLGGMLSKLHTGLNSRESDKSDKSKTLPDNDKSDKGKPLSDNDKSDKSKTLPDNDKSDKDKSLSDAILLKEKKIQSQDTIIDGLKKNISNKDEETTKLKQQLESMDAKIKDMDHKRLLAIAKANTQQDRADTLEEILVSSSEEIMKLRKQLEDLTNTQATDNENPDTKN